MTNPLTRLPLWCRTVMAVALLGALTAVEQHFTHAASGVALAGVGLALGPIRSFSKDYSFLKTLGIPTGGQPESIPWTLYDTQQYAAAGQAQLNFFNGSSSAGDQTLTNFSTGLLQTNTYFEIHRIFLELLAVPTTAAAVQVAGAANDVEILHKTARGVVSWNYNGKPYGPVPMAYCGRPGGPVPRYAIAAAAAETISTGETAENGGFPVVGNIVIAPMTQFAAQMQFISTALNAAMYVRFSMMGVLHRPVA